MCVAYSAVCCAKTLMASGAENGSRSTNFSSAAVAPLVRVPVTLVPFVIFVVGLTGLVPGLIGAVNATPPLAGVKSLGLSTSARWPKSVLGFGMHIAFSFILFCNSLSVEYVDFEVMVLMLGIMALVVVVNEEMIISVLKDVIL